MARLKQAGLYVTKEQKGARDIAMKQLTALGVVITTKTGTVTREFPASQTLKSSERVALMIFG